MTFIIIIYNNNIIIISINVLVDKVKALITDPFVRIHLFKIYGRSIGCECFVIVTMLCIDSVVYTFWFFCKMTSCILWGRVCQRERGEEMIVYRSYNIHSLKTLLGTSVHLVIHAIISLLCDSNAMHKTMHDFA